MLANRLVYYRGAVQARALEQQQRNKPQQMQQAGTSASARQADRVLDLTPATMALDPALAGLFSYGTSGG